MASSDSEDDDDCYAEAQVNDPCLNRCLCSLLVGVVALGALAATRTTIFDKMKGAPLSTTEFTVGVVATIVFGCVAAALLARRMDRNAAVHRTAHHDSQRQQGQQGKRSGLPTASLPACSISPAAETTSATTEAAAAVAVVIAGNGANISAV